MKRFDSKRLLSILLAAAMIFSCLPQPVYAVDETETDPIQISADDSSRDIPVGVLTATTGDYEDAGGESEGPAALVLDGNTGTLWHTDWYGTSRDNHWIQFALSEDYTVDGLRYQPRQGENSSNGTITGYEIQVSDDGNEFETVTTGTWENNKDWKIATFNGVQTKFVRLVATDSYSDNSYVFASAAEIRLTGTETVEGDDLDEHNYDDNGFCTDTDCGAYQPAVLNDEGVYEISNGGQLYWFAALVNGGETDADAILTDDITVNEDVLAEGALNTEGTFRAWTPINAYAGTFDGDEYTVSGLYFNDSTVGNVGLFGSTAADAQIKNLTLADSYIAGKNYVGGLVGNNAGTIENCHNGATVTATNYYLGGVAAYSTGLIDGCSNSGNIISNSNYVGGVVGKLENATIRNSYNTGTISPNGTYVGGVVGQASGAAVENCYNEGTVTASESNSKYVGGVVGKLGDVSTATNCYNSGTVTGKARTGGVVGAVVGTNFSGEGEASTVSKCYNTGDVSGSSYVGGVAGANDNGGRVENCFNAGSVSGSSITGGVLGLNNFYATLDNSYNVGTVSSGNGVVGQNDNVVTDCYYLAESESDELDGTTAKTEAQFASGEVTYLLNGSTDEGELVWKQTLETHGAPQFEGEVVHYNSEAESHYYNGEPVIVPDHHYDNGFCTDADCGAYQPAEQNEDGVYEISNGGQLYWFMELVNAGTTDAKAILVDNIHVNAGTFAADGTYTAADGETVRDWTSIGTSAAPFVGSFDGNNKTVSGLHLNKTENYVGFVSYLGEGGTVKNLTIANSYFHGKGHVGAVAAQNKGTVEGCTNSSFVSSDSMTIGGIVSDNYGTVTGCTNNGTVESTDSNVGGIAGDNSGTVTGCSNTGSVTSTSSIVGGIVGNNSGTISNSTNSGAVTAANTAGGIVGKSTGDVSDSTNSGNVTANSDIGGIAGMAMCNITRCSNSGTIGAANGTTTTGAGGIVGKGGTTSNTDKTVISQCYNTGVINAKSNAGGIAGQIGGTVNVGNSSAESYMDIEDCYNTGNVNGVVNNGVNLGGIVGNVANAESCVEDCYNTGTVKAIGNYATYIGGVAGKAKDVASITNCFYESGCAKDGKSMVQMGVGSKTAGQSTADVADSTTGKTEEQFASGEVTYLLNGSTDEGEPVWKQTLGSAEAPQFEGEVVHYNSDAVPPYYNGEPVIAHQHHYENGFCSGDDCDAPYEPAVLNDEDVYEISNGGQLYWFADLVNTSGDDAVIDAVLTADIVVNEAPLSESSRAWNPIGYYKKTTDKVYYSGTFDGQGHTVSGLYCVKTKAENASDYVGLFGRVDRNGTVKNLGVVDSEFTGRNNVGGVAGGNYYGTITGCWNDSKISGNSHVGGVVGGNAGTVSNCYNSGTVTGTNTSTIVRTYTGGVAGSSNEGSVTNCYNIGEVNGQNTVAPVVDMTANNATIENCYYLADSETDSLDGTTAKTADQFASGEVTYLLNGSTDEGELVWKQTLETDGAPKFKGEVVHLNSADGSYYNGEVEVTHQHDYQNGFCSGDDCDAPYEPAELNDEGVYEISNGGQLYWFAEKVNAGETDIDAVLMNDIYVNQNVQAEGEFRAWTPINGYTGTFDGGEHTISGLYFNDENTDYVGLFGKVGTDGLIENVTLADSYLRGKLYVGGIVGQAEGANITNCHNSGTVAGSSYVGGVVGYIKKGLVTDCSNTGIITGTGQQVGGVAGGVYGEGTTKFKAIVSGCTNAGAVSGKLQVGGVVGHVEYGTVQNSSNSASVTATATTGNAFTGGVVGYFTATSTYNNVLKCYNTGDVTGARLGLGGVVGTFCGGVTSKIENCYNTGSVTNTGASLNGGIVGRQESGQVLNSYNTGSVNGIGDYNGGIIGRKNGGSVPANCYYLADSESDELDGITAKTNEQFASGEVAYLLNSSKSDESVVWKQTLTGENVDETPNFVGQTVYMGYISCAEDAQSVYSNDSTASATKPNHDWADATCTAPKTCKVCGATEGGTADHTYVNGFCSACDAYQPAKLVDGVYQISNGGQLYWFAEKVNAGETDLDAILMNDIYVNTGVLDEEGNLVEDTYREWTPIGGLNAAYNGTFDGNGKTISGLYFNNTADGVDYVGLVGNLSGTVKNVTVEASYIAASEYVGGIVGRTSGTAKIEKCTNKATVHGATYSTGGIVGYNNAAVVSECVNYGHISGDMTSVGGIVGQNLGSATITKSVNYGKVYGKGGSVGGIAGQNKKSIIEYCINYGSVEGGAAKVGGIAGTNETTGGALRYSYNLGSVKGSAANVGALVGYQNMATIDRNYYLSTATYTDGKGKAQKGIGHKTAGSVTNDSALKYVGLTEEGFASGEATYNMNNGSRGNEVWHQTLGTDTYPTYTGTDIVNWGYSTCDTSVPRSYSNEERYSSRPAHDWADATCEDPKTCNRCGLTDGEALGHAYGEPVFVWNDTTASATVTCANDAEHVVELDVTVTSVDTEGDCENAPYTTYTATAEYDGETYTAEKVVTGQLLECVDENDDHLCDVCGKELSKCADENNDHLCDVCGKELSECADKDNDHLCDVCDKELSECADKDNDHLCDVCDKELSECADKDNDHLCDVCDKELSKCADENKDHKCDTCGKELSKCADENKDHKCDTCGKELSKCADENKDHKCDTCGKELSKCADENKDHKCDTCGKELSNCADEDGDGKCDTCGADLETESTECPKDETCVLSVFTDVALEAWYHDGAHYCVEEGLMNGTGNNKFEPNKAATRAMLVTILWRVEGSPKVDGLENPFSDVFEGQWFYEAVVWAYHNGVVYGTSATTFSPNKSITREQIATILYRYSGSPETKGTLDDFVDGDTVSEFAVDAMKWAVETGLINGIPKGNDMLIAPLPMSETDVNGNATRAQVATILWRYLTK